MLQNPRKAFCYFSCGGVSWTQLIQGPKEKGTGTWRVPLFTVFGKILDVSVELTDTPTTRSIRNSCPLFFKGLFKQTSCPHIGWQKVSIIPAKKCSDWVEWPLCFCHTGESYHFIQLWAYFRSLVPITDQLINWKNYIGSYKVYLNYCLTLLLNDLPYLSNLGRPTAKNTSGEKNKNKKERTLLGKQVCSLPLGLNQTARNLKYIFSNFIYLFIPRISLIQFHCSKLQSLVLHL